jgi:AAT family amino acid transporter
MKGGLFMEAMVEERFGAGYLEERKLVKRWAGPIPAIVVLVFTLAIFYVTWWIFQDPRGMMRMYTPYVGYMYTRWWLIVLIWMVYIFNYWPFKRKWLETTHPLIKGTVLTAISVAILYVLIKGFFEGLLGNFGLAYFNPGQLTKLPGITEFFAIEYAALACLMFAALASWLSPAWIVACEEAPWQDLKQPSKGVSILIVTFFLSTLIYFMTMHSHMGILYYPWQYFTSIAPPYWEKFANTVSGNFHVSWIMCCTVSVWLVETIWERYPFNLIKRDGLRRVVAFFGIIVIAFAMHFFLYFAQELTWGEAIRGTRRDAAPDWRWLHVGEMAVFFLVPALFITFYCDNWPKKYSMPVNVLIRTGITIVAAVALYVFYYKTSHLFLGTQKGFSHPQQFPMIPTIWLINIWLAHHWFMDNWPGWKMVPKTAEEIAEDHAVHQAKIADVKWNPSLGWGLGTGALAGVALYFITVWLLPVVSRSVTIIK